MTREVLLKLPFALSETNVIVAGAEVILIIAEPDNAVVSPADAMLEVAIVPGMALPSFSR